MFFPPLFSCQSSTYGFSFCFEHKLWINGKITWFLVHSAMFFNAQMLNMHITCSCSLFFCSCHSCVNWGFCLMEEKYPGNRISMCCWTWLSCRCWKTSICSSPHQLGNTMPLFEAFSFLRSIKQTCPGRRGSFKLLRDVTTLLIFYLAVKQQYPSANTAL